MTEEEKANERRILMFQAMQEEFQLQQDALIGNLYNQFIVFISTSELDLTQVLLVLKMIEWDLIKQATEKYTGGG